MAERPLAEVEDDARLPAFALRAVKGNVADAVRHATGAEYVYYASSWQGCGCGFSYETEAAFEEHLASAQDEPALERMHRENRSLELASVQSLSRYVAEASVVGPLAVYAVNEAKVGVEPTLRLPVEPEFFGGPSFNFGDGSAMFEPTGLYEIAARPELRAV